MFQDIKNYILAILIIASLTFAVRVAIVTYRLIRSPILSLCSRKPKPQLDKLF
jgi:peptidoglycan/LPS O-acetylase OafA/YrhL